MLKEQYREHPSEVIALGECGIDLHYPTHRNLAHQQELLRLQAVLARELQLPLVIHSRDAYVETLEVIKDFTDLKVYFHCWGYGAAQLRQIEELFPRVWFGFTNILTYPHAHTTREAFLAANKAHLLLETDAPFLPPQTFRGKTNYPAYITYGYAYAAELLQMKTEAVEDLIAQNFSAFYHQ
jgi:TatD DNase family protein